MLAAYYEDEAQKILKPIRTFYSRKGVDVDFVAKHGDPASVAATADKGKFNLLVLGSHGHGALANLVLGSVATKVIANCRVPVLLVR